VANRNHNRQNIYTWVGVIRGVAKPQSAMTAVPSSLRSRGQSNAWTRTLADRKKEAGFEKYEAFYWNVGFNHMVRALGSSAGQICISKWVASIAIGKMQRALRSLDGIPDSTERQPMRRGK